MDNEHQLLPEAVMNLAYKAIDYAAKNIQETKNSFTPFAFFLSQEGETSLVRFTSDNPDEVSQMVQAEIDKVADTLASYVIAQDAYTTFDDIKRESIIIEAGCAFSGRAIQLVQQYSLEQEYKEHGNVKMVAELPLRMKKNEAVLNETVELLEPLFMAPFAVFYKVASADGTIDDKEMEVFLDLLVKGVKHTNPLVSSLVARSVKNIQESILMISNDEIDAEIILPKVKSLLLSEFSQGDCDTYLDFLNKLAIKIAQPTGGFLGFGRKISDSDLQAIKQIEELLS